MQPDTEITLLQYLNKGDKSAFDNCYLTYRKPLQATAFSILQNDEDAKDVVQQLFIDLWEKKLYLSISGSLKSYLYVAVKNRSINRLEENDTRRKHLANILYQSTEIILPDDRIQQNERKKELFEAIQELLRQYPQTFKVLELRYLHGKSRKEIAAETGTSPNTIRNQLVKALKIIRGKLKR